MRAEPDAEVLARFVQGEREAFERLFREFERDVFRWIVRIVREPGAAEDVLVETFWRAYRARARFDPSRTFGAWIRRIATNAALAQLRSMRRHPRWSDLDERTAARGSDHDLQEAIAIAFRSLPPDLLAVARLALIEQLPQAEIADALDVPIGTVKSRLFRAQRALRDALRQQGIQQ